jgi:hypothetical protein
MTMYTARMSRQLRQPESSASRRSRAMHVAEGDSKGCVKHRVVHGNQVARRAKAQGAQAAQGTQGPMWPEMPMGLKEQANEENDEEHGWVAQGLQGPCAHALVRITTRLHVITTSIVAKLTVYTNRGVCQQPDQPAAFAACSSQTQPQVFPNKHQKPHAIQKQTPAASHKCRAWPPQAFQHFRTAPPTAAIIRQLPLPTADASSSSHQQQPTATATASISSSHQPSANSSQQ